MALLALGLTACGATSSTQTFNATLNGTNEKPATITTPATGTATATLDGKTLKVTGTFKDLTSAVATANGADMMHVHKVEKADGTGGVLFPLTGTLAADRRSGSFEGTKVLTDDEVTLLTTGKLYVNIHTGNNPGGEIRGDLVKK